LDGFDFPFGFGLSYTTYEYSHLLVEGGKEPIVSFTLKNTGARAGAEVAQVYVALPAAAGEPPKRLAAFSKVQLNPGESREVSLPINPRELFIYEEGTNSWKQLPGGYTFMVGGWPDDSDGLQRFIENVAPKVRELVAAGRESK